MTKLKMYVIIHETVPVGYAVVAAAHTALATFLKFRDDSNVQAWISPGPFYKVVVRATEAEFATIKDQVTRGLLDGVVLTEAALGGREVAIGLKPRTLEWPEIVRKLPLYK